MQLCLYNQPGSMAESVEHGSNKIGQDWLIQCQDNVTEWYISGHGVDGLVSQWGCTIKSP